MKRFCVAVLVLIAFQTEVLGGTQTEFVKVETGKFDDSSLAGFTTYAMRVTADTDWTNADITIDISDGTINSVTCPFLGSCN